MKKLREILIRFMGGISPDEQSASYSEYYEMGRNSAYNEMLIFAKDLNGLSAEEWCDTMYRHLASQRHSSASQQS